MFEMIILFNDQPQTAPCAFCRGLKREDMILKAAK
jgi:hypothetical protein